MEYITFIPSYVNTIIISILITFLGIIIAKTAEKFTFQIIKELELSRVVQKATDIQFSIENFISNVVKWGITFISIIIALRFLGIQNIVLNVLLIVGGFILIVSILLSINDWIPNIFAYFSIRNIKEGSKINCGIEGELLKLHATHVVIMTKNGDIYRVPNTSIKHQSSQAYLRR